MKPSSEKLRDAFGVRSITKDFEQQALFQLGVQQQ